MTGRSDDDTEEGQPFAGPIFLVRQVVSLLGMSDAVLLLVEDNAGDEMITREAFQQNKIAKKVHVLATAQKAWTFSTAAASTTTPRDPTPSCSTSTCPNTTTGKSSNTIVVLTTSSAQEDILRSHKLHASAYITKPVDFDRYLKAVRQIDEFFVQVVRLPPRG